MSHTPIVKGIYIWGQINLDNMKIYGPLPSMVIMNKVVTADSRFRFRAFQIVIKMFLMQFVYHIELSKLPNKTCCPNDELVYFY